MSYKEIDIEDVYGKDGKLKKEDVENLMVWVKLQPHLPQITGKLFLLGSYTRYYWIRMNVRKLETTFYEIYQNILL